MLRSIARKSNRIPLGVRTKRIFGGKDTATDQNTGENQIPPIIVRTQLPTHDSEPEDKGTQSTVSHVTELPCT